MQCSLSSKTGSSAKDSIRTYPISEHPVYIRIFKITIYDLLKFAEEPKNCPIKFFYKLTQKT